MTPPDAHLDADGKVILDPQDQPDQRPPHLQPAAIAACQLCDHDGLKNGFPCDHTDHTAAAQRGIAAVRAAMGWPADKHPTKPLNIARNAIPGAKRHTCDSPQHPKTDQPTKPANNPICT